MQFDLTGIPAGTSIISATLNLHEFCSSSWGGGHNQLSGSNHSTLWRCTEAWSDFSVTWNTQPAIDITDSIDLDSSMTEFQHYLDIDKTDWAQDMINDPANNNGVMLKIDLEEHHRRLLFGSNDNTDGLIKPYVEIVLNNGSQFVSGCITTASIEQVKTEPISTPFKFSPNGDGVFDVLEIKVGPFYDLEFSVYDLYGKLLYVTTDQNSPWDGTLNGMPVKAEAYTWCASYLNALNEQEVICNKFILVK